MDGWMDGWIDGWMDGCHRFTAYVNSEHIHAANPSSTPSCTDHFGDNELDISVG